MEAECLDCTTLTGYGLRMGPSAPVKPYCQEHANNHHGFAVPLTICAAGHNELQRKVAEGGPSA